MIALLLACDETPADLALPEEEPADPADWPCGGYAPMAAATLPYGDVSFRYTHAYDDEDDGVGTLVFECVGAYEEGGDELWGFRQHGESATDVTSLTWDIVTAYQCVDGALLHAHQSFQTVTTTEAGETTEAYDRTYTTRPVAYVAGMAVGDAWDYDGAYVDTLPDGGTREGTVWAHREIAAEEEVEVPAGTFTALDLEITGPDGGEPDHLYLAWGIGVVKASAHQLTSWQDFR